MTTMLLKTLLCFIGSVLCNENFTNEDYNITHFDGQNVTVSYHGSGNLARSVLANGQFWSE